MATKGVKIITEIERKEAQYIDLGSCLNGKKDIMMTKRMPLDL